MRPILSLTALNEVNKIQHTCEYTFMKYLLYIKQLFDLNNSANYKKVLWMYCSKEHTLPLATH